MITWTYVLHALTPLHPGTGRGVGLIDLPIARERATGHPLVPGSSVKGVFRDACRGVDASAEADLFGPQPLDEDDHASALRFSDARIALFPVQSDRGTFAWVTCPWVLARLARDVTALPGGSPPDPADGCLVTRDSVLHDKSTVTLDGLPFRCGADQGRAGQWAEALATLVFPPGDKHAIGWNGLMRQRFCVVGDDSFTWLVQNATEVRARIRIDDRTGTVAKGGLWYEEALPAETVLVGLVQYVDNQRSTAGQAGRVFDRIVASPMQVGGHASTGQGAVRVRLHGGD